QSITIITFLVTAFTLNCDRETRSLEFAVFCVQLGVHRKTEKEILFSFLFDLPSKSDSKKCFCQ
ncbi:hypothetical protein, partial [Fusicatenibacter saccharivorans]|uniref:hypothetical protein n=1 Tax=Fusicatenibacter saccharivorans TaxID=1150298 RepID=UPI001D014E99